MGKVPNRHCSIMLFLWFVLLMLAIGGMSGSVYGGIYVLIRDGVNSRWWIGVVGFFAYNSVCSICTSTGASAPGMLY